MHECLARIIGNFGACRPSARRGPHVGCPWLHVRADCANFPLRGDHKAILGSGLRRHGELSALSYCTIIVYRVQQLDLVSELTSTVRRIYGWGTYNSLAMRCCGNVPVLWLAAWMSSAGGNSHTTVYYISSI